MMSYGESNKRTTDEAWSNAARSAPRHGRCMCRCTHQRQVGSCCCLGLDSTPSRHTHSGTPLRSSAGCSLPIESPVAARRTTGASPIGMHCCQQRRAVRRGVDRWQKGVGGWVGDGCVCVRAHVCVCVGCHCMCRLLLLLLLFAHTWYAAFL